MYAFPIWLNKPRSRDDRFRHRLDQSAHQPSQNAHQPDQSVDPLVNLSLKSVDPFVDLPLEGVDPIRESGDSIVDLLIESADSFKHCFDRGPGSHIISHRDLLSPRKVVESLYAGKRGQSMLRHIINPMAFHNGLIQTFRYLIGFP